MTKYDLGRLIQHQCEKRVWGVLDRKKGCLVGAHDSFPREEFLRKEAEEYRGGLRSRTRGAEMKLEIQGYRSGGEDGDPGPEE